MTTMDIYPCDSSKVFFYNFIDYYNNQMNVLIGFIILLQKVIYICLLQRVY
jgi:hypothetical protein